MASSDDKAPVETVEKSNSTRKDQEKSNGGTGGGAAGFVFRRYADLIGIAVVMLGMLYPLLMGNGSGGLPKLDVVELDQSFYKTVLYPDKPAWDKGGPNNAGVSWAVFFHKPYCGACRRIRPMFYALARHTNSSQHLRFASVDCVKYRAFCKREKVDREPLIRLYQSVSLDKHQESESQEALLPPSQRKVQSQSKDKVKANEPTPALVRRGVADWKGMLVAYEVFEWFRKLNEQGPLAGLDILWPGDDTLALEMHTFKQSALHTGMKLDTAAAADAGQTADPKGYLVDMHSAVMLGLVDDVFGGHTTSLDGKRLATLLNFLETLAHVYPLKEMRTQFSRLHDALGRRDVWGEKPYAALLQQWKEMMDGGGGDSALMATQEPPPTGADVAGAPTMHYKWCRSNDPGVGGYPCGLWLLFHSMIANSDARHAHLTLSIIYEWVQSFYGCVECAANFNSEWEEELGSEQFGHVRTSLWLWKVHNMVRARLTEDDDSIKPKNQWPSPTHCPNCLSDQSKERLGLPVNASADLRTSAEIAVVAAAAGANQVAWNDEDWSPEFIFSFLQETFCAGSDTFVCAGFVDEGK